MTKLFDHLSPPMLYIDLFYTVVKDIYLCNNFDGTINTDVEKMIPTVSFHFHSLHIHITKHKIRNRIYITKRSIRIRIMV